MISSLKSPADTHTVSAKVLTAFHAALKQHVKRDAAKQEAVQTRNQKAVAKFDRDELDEDHP